MIPGHVLRATTCPHNPYASPGPHHQGRYRSGCAGPGGHPGLALCPGSLFQEVRIMTRQDRQAQRHRARQVRAGLRLVVPSPKVEADKRRPPRAQERQSVRRAWREAAE